MSDSPATVAQPPARRDRSAEGRRAAKRRKADREQRILRMLTAGASMAEIAMREGVTRRRMRAIVQEILSRPRPDETPSEFATLQVVRLNEALRASYSAMSGGNLRAVDRVVRIVRELDRYHGFPARPGAMAEPRRLGPPAA